jgi:hypothetical protein
MEKITIYGLVDPNTHEVRYVGQARDPIQRFLGHISEAPSGLKPIHAWIRSLHPLRPVWVLLEAVKPRQN